MADKHLKRSEKLQLLLNEEELRAIDDWRFQHRLPTRAAALRELLRRGLKASVGQSIPETDHVATGDFSVVSTE